MNPLFALLPLSLVYATPLIIAGLGGLFSERSGVVNIALEGLMMIGAFTAASVTVSLEPHPMAAVAGLLAGMTAGVGFSQLHAFASIHLKANQIIAGMALNLLAGGSALYVCQALYDQQSTPAFSLGISKTTLPWLNKIPILGPILFRDTHFTTHLAWFLALLTASLLFRTPFGLRLRACGENPHAAASAGIKVTAIRYAGVSISGALAGLAGAILVLTQDIQYSASTVHGNGFIALACLIFGQWSPWGVLGAGLFFGFSQTLSLFAKDIPGLRALPQEGFFMLPYLLTLFALVLFCRRSSGPKAAGEIYETGA